jgi:hypothetical protein
MAPPAADDAETILSKLLPVDEADDASMGGGSSSGEDDFEVRRLRTFF